MDNEGLIPHPAMLSAVVHLEAPLESRANFMARVVERLIEIIEPGPCDVHGMIDSDLESIRHLEAPQLPGAIRKLERARDILVVAPPGLKDQHEALMCIGCSAVPSMDCFPVDPQLQLDLNMAMVKPSAHRTWRSIIEAWFGAADETGLAYSGLVDVDSVTSLDGGTFYSNLPFFTPSLHRLVEHREWLEAGDRRREMVRSTRVWGQYLGSRLLEKATPKRNLIERYLREPGTGKRDQKLAVSFEHGVFVSLSPSPADMLEPATPEMQQNALWLRRLFRQSRMTLDSLEG